MRTLSRASGLVLLAALIAGCGPLDDEGIGSHHQAASLGSTLPGDVLTPDRWKGDVYTVFDGNVDPADGMSDYLEVNLGPARKKGEKWCDGVWKFRVRDIGSKGTGYVTTAIFIGTALEQGLKAYQNKGNGKAVINSIMARSDRMEKLMPFMTKYDAGMVALLWGPEGTPRDENERGKLAKVCNPGSAAGSCGRPKVPIPDQNSKGLTASVTVSDSASFDRLYLVFEVKHKHPPEILIELTRPKVGK